MNEPAENSEHKSRRKWPWVTALCIVVLIGLVRLALMTSPVQNWVKNFIVDTANKQLKPSLSIGALSGDLWNGATLTNIKLTNSDTVASIDTLHLEYSPLSYFSDLFQIHEVRVVDPFLSLQQQPDSTFNVQHWMKAPADTATSDTTGTFAFSISNLLIDDGRIAVKAPQLQPDSAFLVTKLNIGGNIGMDEKGFNASVRKMNFMLQNTPVDGPITVNAVAQASPQQMTLERLAIATGKSLLQATADVNLNDSTFTARAEAKPLGWKDIASFTDSVRLRKNLRMSLHLEGSADQFDINFKANADGIEQLVLHSTIRRDSVFALRGFEASANRLDMATFMGDTTMPSLQDLKLKAEGTVPFGSYQQAQIDGTLRASNIKQGSYRLDALQGVFSLDDGTADLHLEPVANNNRLVVDLNASRIWSDQPRVRVSFRGSGINPSHWLPESNTTGHLTFNGRVSGAGWYPQQQFWDYRLNVSEGRLNGQKIDQATFSGQLTQQAITNNSRIVIGESTLRLQAEAGHLQSVPTYSYQLITENLNLADFSGYEDYTTSLTATIKGKGRGSSMENLALTTSAQVDSSMVMGELIEHIRANIRIDNEIAFVDSVQIRSGIADGSMQGRINLQDFYGSESRMNLNMQLKDLSALAPAAGVDILQATGSLNGDLKPVGKDSLAFEGAINLQDINYNNQFIAEQIAGDVVLELKEDPQYAVNIDVKQPSISSLPFQNIGLKTEGTLADSATSGSYQIALAGENEGRIDQAGSYRVGEDSVAVELTQFDLTSALRTLSLQRPFHATFAGGALQTDTLQIRSKDGAAFLRLAVPFADTTRQRGYLRAQKLNLSVLQDAILHETLVRGLLSANVELSRSDSSLTASGDILMSELMYNQTSLDTLQLSAQIKNDRLKGSLELHQGGERIVDGAANIPFSSKDPTQLSDKFFQQPVEGYLRLREIELNRFSRLLKAAGYQKTDGSLQFYGKLKGQAGQPKLNAKLSLKDAHLSGVPVDSLIASMDYEHEQSNLNLNATLTSLKQKALVVDAKMPLIVDLRKHDVALPGPQDSISVAVEANKLNLKALNDFLDPAMARNLQGYIDGKIDITGPRSSPQASGKIKLEKGAVRIVTAGIRLDHIKSSIQFRADEIVLERLRMESGSGNLHANGTLALEQLVPEDMDISVEAENFKAANTDSYNGIIDLDMKIGGRVDRPKITGNIDIINGFVELDNFGEKSVEQVSLDTTMTPETQTSLYDSLTLDLDLEFNNRFYVRNERYLEMEIELDGQLDILKSAGEDLQLFGTLSTNGGYARPLGKQFELEEGSLAFSGPPDNPQINIRTLYEPPQANQEIKIWYIIEGTVEDPQFKYESEPPMDLAGIISYTLFGQPFYKLNPAEQSVASSSSNNSAADFAVEVLLDRVESIATKRLGIDVVRIEQTRVGGDSGTSVTTGWYINPKVFFAIQNVITGSTPTTGFYLEYYLQENLKLILSQGNDNRQGVDLQWEYDY